MPLDLTHVFVARSIDPHGDHEPYVFGKREDAEAFAELQADDYLVSEEPILDRTFVNIIEKLDDAKVDELPCYCAKQSCERCGLA